MLNRYTYGWAYFRAHPLQHPPLWLYGAIVVGLLITVPVSLLALTFVYKKLAAQVS